MTVLKWCAMCHRISGEPINTTTKPTRNTIRFQWNIASIREIDERSTASARKHLHRVKINLNRIPYYILLSFSRFYFAKYFFRFFVCTLSNTYAVPSAWQSLAVRQMSIRMSLWLVPNSGRRDHKSFWITHLKFTLQKGRVCLRKHWPIVRALSYCRRPVNRFLIKADSFQ